MPRPDQHSTDPTDEFESLLSRIERGTATKADFQQLREALTQKLFQVRQLGKYNINIGQGQEIQIGDRTYVEINDAAVEAIVAAIQQRSLRPRRLDKAGIQRYLRSLLDDEIYREWQDLYTPTTVEDRRHLRQQDTTQAPQRKVSPRLKLRVETVKPPKEGQQGSGTGEREPREQVEQLDVLEGLRKYAANHVLLIGKPGSGKSTSLERLLWEEADKALKNSNARIPVFVKLRRCTGTIEALIRDFLSRHQLMLDVVDVEELLRQGKFLLLLDGLNELPEAFKTEIINFRDRYHRTTPMIFSTRDLAIGGTLGVEKPLKMLPLTEPQMQEFVQGYLGAEGNRLLQQVKGDRLQKFAETPLLLWMLCRVFAQSGRVPTNLGLAFREFAQLYDHDIQQDVPSDSSDQWCKLLRYLAFALMQGNTLTDLRLSMSKEEAENRLTDYLRHEGRANPRDYAERWLKDLLKYHLIQPVIQDNFEEHIEFRHQLIQEYYAAEYLLRIFETLTDEELKRDYLNYVKWTEPIALMLALVEDEALAVRVVEQALAVDLMLGSRLAGKVRSDFQKRTIDIIQRLQGSRKVCQELMIELSGETGSDQAVSYLIQNLNDSVFSGSAAEALGKMYSKEAALGLIQFIEKKSHFGMYSHDIFIAVDSLGKLGKIGSEQAVTALLELSNSLDCTLRGSVCEALAKTGLLQVIPAILKLTEDLDSYVSAKAIEALVEISSDQSIPALVSLLKDSNSHIRNSAVQVLCHIESDQSIPTLVSLLKDSNSHIRGSAAYILGEIGSEKVISNLIQALHYSADDPGCAEIATQYQYWREGNYARINASIALGKIATRLNEKGDRRTAKKVVEPLIDDLDNSDIDVRIHAALGLGKLCSEQAIPILVQALNYPEDYVVAMAAITLGEIGSEQAVNPLKKALKDCGDYGGPIFDAIYGALSKIVGAELLVELWTWQLDAPHGSFSSAIAAIQSRCKFYNYEILQAAIQNQEQMNLAKQTTQPSPTDLLAKIDQTTQQIDQRTQHMADQPKYHFPNAQQVQIIEQNQGQVVGEQHNYATNPEVQSMIADLQTLLTQLQTQHPHVTAETEAIAILDAEFTAIKHSETPRFASLRQQLLNPERHLQAIKATLGEVAKHYLEESVWAKAILTYLDKLSESPNGGA